jgi:hypothetical protein
MSFNANSMIRLLFTVPDTCPPILGRAGRIEHGMIGDIEEFCAELQTLGFCDGNVLQHRKVYLFEIIPPQNVATACARSALNLRIYFEADAPPDRGGVRGTWIGSPSTFAQRFAISAFRSTPSPFR